MDRRIDSVLMAKYLLNKAYEKEIPMSMTKLQKMLYALDGVLLANDANVLNEHCRAWQYGPVYPKVFMYFRKEEDAYNKIFSDEDFSLIKNHNKSGLIDKAINLVIEKLGNHTGTELSNWSHAEGSPWSKTERGSKIDKALIKRYFLGNE